MTKKKGWKGEPARHSLAARGYVTELRKARASLKISTGTGRHFAKAGKQLLRDWEGAKPALKRALALHDKLTYDVAITQKEIVGLERLREDYSDVFLDFAMDALAIRAVTVAHNKDAEKVIADIDKMMPESLAVAQEYLRD